ncbi:MAG: VacJ family lipoprotein [Pseudomonadota bacterium]
MDAFASSLQCRGKAARLASLLVLCIGMTSMWGCSHTAVDPYEQTNRKIQAFNDGADRVLFKPVAKAYRTVTPDFAEAGIANFISNLNEPYTALNQLLQGKPGLAIHDLGRFLINSTFGLGGLIDAGTDLGLEKHTEDLGQTLGVWGMGAGPYLVLPIFGPSNPRDAIGLIGNNLGNPPVYLEDRGARNAAVGMQIIDARAQLLKAERLIRGDRYLFLRDAYLQRRDYLVNDGVVEDSFLDD